MNTNKKVAILMSTYNGEKYLEEQINSIVDQSYSDWDLYIRDDGSNDQTPQIIQKYAAQFSNIHFFNEKNIKNVGVVRSFMDLLQNTEADFYMFSDQDDFWKKNKVKKTLEKMVYGNDQSIPLCVHTDLQIVDSQLSGTAVMNGNDVWHDFLRLMFGNCVTGCTMMINEALKKLLDFNQVDTVYMHDWWIALVAAAFGKILYLNEPTILYRQHNDNVVGEAEKNKFKRFFHRQMDIENMLNVFSISDSFKRVYGEQLNGNEKRYIYAYSNLIPQSNFGTNLKLVLQYPPKRKTLIGKVFFSYLVVKHHKLIKNITKKGN